MASFLPLAFLSVASAYSQNAICRQNRCLNPAFPAMNDMPKLEKFVWECSSEGAIKPYLDFCKDAIHYDAALPSPKTGQGMDSLVNAQDEAALTMFFQHVSAMGFEAWEYSNPSQSSPCVKSVWQMVCYTYFPKQQAGCKPGEATQYYRPCRDCCEHYLQACSVECCDESTACVFQTASSTGIQMIETGYVDAVGPSTNCTGSAGLRGAAKGRSSPMVLLLLLFGCHVVGMSANSERSSSRQSSSLGVSRIALSILLLGCAMGLQGCAVSLNNAHHDTGNWRRQPNYLINYAYIPPGQNTSAAVLNSCSASAAVPCSGNGVCKQWKRSYVVPGHSAISFCQCDPGWADPECRTARKSQFKTFLFALFGGFIGADYFYLGFPVWGIAKALTLGGFGFWWLTDVVRSGAGPVYAANFRTAADLPHFVFVIVTCGLFIVVGFVLSLRSYVSLRSQKHRDLMKIQQREECRALGPLDEVDGPRFEIPDGQSGFNGSRAFSGYGTQIPMPLPSAGAPRIRQTV